MIAPIRAALDHPGPVLFAMIIKCLFQVLLVINLPREKAKKRVRASSRGNPSTAPRWNQFFQIVRFERGIPSVIYHFLVGTLKSLLFLRNLLCPCWLCWSATWRSSYPP